MKSSQDGAVLVSDGARVRGPAYPLGGGGFFAVCAGCFVGTPASEGAGFFVFGIRCFGGMLATSNPVSGRGARLLRFSAAVSTAGTTTSAGRSAEGTKTEAGTRAVTVDDTLVLAARGTGMGTNASRTAGITGTR
jgi:hypothetical protein